MGGVGLQQFFILVFVIFAIKFHTIVRLQMRQGVPGVSRALPLLYAVYAVLALITVCCPANNRAPSTDVLRSYESSSVSSNTLRASRALFRITKYINTA